MSTELDLLPGAVALGRQMTVEFYDCAAEILSDAAAMERIFLEAAEVSGAHVVNSNFHSFEPQGVSGVVVISESHFAVHAWPEHDYAAVDLFTCGSGVDFDLAIESLGKGMRSGQWIVSSLANRGILHESGTFERLVPVVENRFSSGMQLSWQERFEKTGARALSAAVDIYGTPLKEHEEQEYWRNFAEKLAGVLNESPVRWLWMPRSDEAEFLLLTDNGRISGYLVPARETLYLNIFTDGFFDPRHAAEFAMDILGGSYYRMQVQIRQ
ncbi:MAG: adenosylmethionine decarboxylase [Lentisphaerae bacterium]|nr:adenosylmethionine decarboxylase [Lentisphaerota bacterium]